MSARTFLLAVGTGFLVYLAVRAGAWSDRAGIVLAMRSVIVILLFGVWLYLRGR